MIAALANLWGDAYAAPLLACSIHLLLESEPVPGAPIKHRLAGELCSESWVKRAVPRPVWKT